MRRVGWTVAGLALAGWRLDAVQAQGPRAQDDPEAVQAAEADDQSPASRAEQLYEEGTDALDEERWDEALRAFDEVLRLGGGRAEGALY
ncbi:MAG TPA: hypothetical protein VFO85_02425, partial [Vicinamibacteria bacterium]|nr:hypothetical protein [Vicinamibacteria bacterium]